MKGGLNDTQRVALVWDTKFVQNIEIHEIFVARKEVQGDDIFNRDPLAGRFVLLENSEPRNDLVVVGLHLASGQRSTRNHDAAMTRLRGELWALRGKHAILPKEEDDIILAGDLNANAFDEHEEMFFTTFNRGNWLVLVGDGYPATRLAGEPLKPGSPIDYILATTKRGRQSGLVGEELPHNAYGQVRTDLIQNDDYDGFRKNFSDHLPVTVCVTLMRDSD